MYISRSQECLAYKENPVSILCVNTTSKNLKENPLLILHQRN